ncbi:MAG: MBL fold metallo-hydrolase [Cyanobacteria bacterium J06638_28]
MKHLRRWAITAIVTLATVVSLVSCQTHTAAQTESSLTLDSAGLTLEELAEGVYGLIASTDFPPADFETTGICNGAIIVGSDGVLVVDPFQSDTLAALMFETVATLTDQPIRYVVNTHYHFDHSGGNATAESLDYPIVGRGPIREFMLTRNLELDPNPAAPDVVVNGDSSLWLGDRQVQLAEFDGHSGGTDLVVYVPDVDVLITGDLLFTQRIPFIGDGSIRLWRSNLDGLAAIYADAKILPGHGPIGDRADLETLQDYLTYLEDLGLEWQAENLSEAAAIAQTTVDSQYADYLFQGLFQGNLEVTYQQITLGQEDVTSIQTYFAAQPPELQAL